MHLPSVVAVAFALMALVSATALDIDSSDGCPILCSSKNCCPGKKCKLTGLVYVSISILRLGFNHTTHRRGSPS
ncbi:hypothetical protein C8R48DRAFT_699254 [Suillus tomentosus]|nr:hypothetical protein C8R48DRAFT_699254 [Suillus tomentosus]